MLLQIDGWFGAGKSVLWALLEGHEEVFTSPIHDYSFSAMLEQNNDLDWIKTKHTEVLRKVLAKTQYFRFEKVFLDGYWSFGLSSDQVVQLPYKIDYYEHDKKFMTNLISEKEWSIEIIIDRLYSSIYETSKKIHNKTSKPQWYASMGNPLFIQNYKNFPIFFPNSKSIQVRRTVHDIIAVRSSRRPRPEDFKTKKFFSDTFDTRINNKEVEDIIDFYKATDNLVYLYPDIFMVVDMEDLILDTKKTMKTICDFLNINYNKKLTKTTYFGQEIKYNDVSFLDQPFDCAENILSREQILQIDKTIHAHKTNMQAM